MADVRYLRSRFGDRPLLQLDSAYFIKISALPNCIDTRYNCIIISYGTQH
ncbi:hypothetical protein QUB61_10490 [Microcoleus sp. C2D2]